MISDSPEARQRERALTEVSGNADEACSRLAAEIASLIRINEAGGRETVLGLATGSTPVKLYRQLVRLHREQGLSFRRVVTFNLDEYYGLSRTHPESYWRFMHEQLFEHIDIAPENINIPDGTIPRGEVYSWCQAYEEKIRKAGGLDLQILGIGRTGHVGFNEPGSTRESRTRLVTLDSLTRRDAARDFLGEANVPHHAITMGVATILEARRVVLLAWGRAKARVVAQALEQPPTDALPASFLQGHPDVRFLIDEAAAGELTRVKRPWLVGSVEWTAPLARRAVVWLARAVEKPVLKLVDEHYSEHGMAELLTEQGPAYDLNIRIFNELQHTITGWPGGKPNADDTHRPERASPHPKRIVVFSPEPSDDLLGMGGTLRRLVQQGHDVTVVYLTSGSLAVPDEEAGMAAELVSDLLRLDSAKATAGVALVEKVRHQLVAREAFDAEGAEVRRLKGIIRRTEAKAALRVCGIERTNIVFLNLPFYESGRYRQFETGPADVAAVVAELRRLKPHQIFATGDLDDPSSVSGICYRIITRAFEGLAGEDWLKDLRVWLYRGPDKEWDVAELDMAVPLSPDELATKIRAIYHHKTQRSQSPVQAEASEAWQQADHRNRETAVVFDRLGLADYEAIEGFRRLARGSRADS